MLLSSHSGRAWLLDSRAGALRSVELGEWADPEDSARWGLAPSGAELWALQPKARRLLRFATPP